MFFCHIKQIASYSCIWVYVEKAMILYFSKLIIKDLGSNVGPTFFQYKKICYESLHISLEVNRQGVLLFLINICNIYNQ